MTTSGIASPVSANTRWGIVVLLMGYAALAHFNRVGISVAGSEVFIKEIGISETRMGWVYTCYLIVYTLGMLPGGWLIDRVGSGHALTLLGLSMGTFVGLTGTLGWLAATPVGLWLGLLGIRALAGACNAPLHPGAAHVVSDLMWDRQRATANGMVTSGALIGIACCFPVFGWLMDHLTWPWAFIVSGAALVAYGVLWRLVAVPPLHGSHAVAEARRQPPAIGAGRALMRHGNLWLLSFSYAAYGYFQYLFFYWMNYYFAYVLHVPEVASRRALFWIMLAQGAGMAIGGVGTDIVCHLIGTRWGRRAIVIAGMGLGALFALMAVQLKEPGGVAIRLALSMGALGMCEGVFWTTATDIGGKARGFAGAFMNTWGNVGGLISPVLTPFMAEHIGWPGAISVACLISGIGGGLWLVITPPDTPSPR